MKIQYFPETDTLAIELTHHPVVITDDLIIDFDAQGRVVAITLDHASQTIKIT